MFVNKKLACPGCGAENRVRFEYNEMMREPPCSECGAIVKWKRKPFGSGGQVRQAFDDHEPELARPPHYPEDSVP
jgi:transcription initiation factor TFIIIB Brf1 subunit/transcription initiation factor TFIIB